MSWGRDIRQAGRQLRRNPGFTAVAVGVLALGIGANTAIFSLINADLLQPLPFKQPSQLVQMYETESAPGSFPLAGPDFPDWKQQSKLFQDMTLYNYPRSVNLSGGGEPQRVIGQPTEANFFSLLGVQPELGRFFTKDEDQPGATPVVVLSHGLWESRFAGNPAILGHAIMLDGQASTVIGVAPGTFNLRQRVDLWTPLDMRDLGMRGNHGYSAIGRMRPGVTLAQAQAEISAIAARLGKQYPDSNADTGARLFLMRDILVRTWQRQTLWILAGVVGLVLLIACANLANLLLARALGRQKEISIRLALGASRGQILRQLLIEAVVLALAGAAAGATLAWVAVQAVVGLSGFTLPAFNPIGVDGAALAFTAALAVACGVLFGLAPAWQLSRPQINAELSGAGQLAGGHRRWLSDGLVAGEIALSLVLAVAAGLLLQSFAKLRGSDLGLNPRDVQTAAIALPGNGYHTDAQLAAFNRTLLTRLRSTPGMVSVTLASELPLEGGSNGYIQLPGETSQRPELAEWTRISDGYLATLQIPVVQGSGYNTADFGAWEKNARGLGAVVNQTFAREFFPGKNPVGARFKASYGNQWLTIKGVAKDVPIFGLGETNIAQVYLPSITLATIHVIVRSPLPQAQVDAGIRRAVAGLDSNLPVYSLRSMDEVTNEAVGGQALEKWLVVAFAGLALLLAAAGIYGVMAFLVGARTREIGVRMALGARRGDVIGMVLRRGLKVAALGCGIGVAAALASGSVLASQLYEVKPGDPNIIAAAVAVLLLTTLAACALPARRAAGVDPNQALRQP